MNCVCIIISQLKTLFCLYTSLEHQVKWLFQSAHGCASRKIQYTISTMLQVLLETLRLYPPVTMISRAAKKGGVTLSGYHITEGTQISVCFYVQPMLASRIDQLLLYFTAAPKYYFGQHAWTFRRFWSLWTLPLWPWQKEVRLVYSSIFHTFNDIFANIYRRPSPFVYFPFGLGPRSCIGKQFSLVRSWSCRMLLKSHISGTVYIIPDCPHDS